MILILVHPGSIADTFVIVKLRGNVLRVRTETEIASGAKADVMRKMGMSLSSIGVNTMMILVGSALRVTQIVVVPIAFALENLVLATNAVSM